MKDFLLIIYSIRITKTNSLSVGIKIYSIKGQIPSVMLNANLSV